jgi:hypothetical protein
MIELVVLAQGNPGAASFLMSLFVNGELTPQGKIIYPVLEEYDITGTDLYVLWSDLCHKDLDLVAHLCAECPKDTLIDACSRQDYSGRELVNEYFMTQQPVDDCQEPEDPTYE